MDRRNLIRGLVLLLVVSLAFAGVYASDGAEVSHADSTDSADGLHISGSADVCHVSSCFKPLDEISTVQLWNHIMFIGVFDWFLYFHFLHFYSIIIFSPNFFYFFIIFFFNLIFTFKCIYCKLFYNIKNLNINY